MNYPMKPLALALAVASLAAAPASAQEQPQEHPQEQHQMQGHDMHGQQGQDMHGQMGQMGQEMHGPMGQAHCAAMMGAANPVMALHHADDLGLSEEQVSELKDRMASAHEAGMSHMRLAMETRASAREILDAESPDLAEYEARLDNAARHMVQAHVAIARAGVDARSVLTADQRSRLQTLPMDHDMGGNGHAMSGMSGMSHEGCPMMMDHGTAENPHTDH